MVSKASNCRFFAWKLMLQTWCLTWKLLTGGEGTLGVVTKVSILTPPKLASTNVAFLACEDYESCQVKHFAVQPFDWKHFFVDDHRNEKLRLTWDPQKPCFFPVPSECFEGSKETTGWNFISIWVHWPSCFGHGNSLQYQNVDCTRLEAVHLFLEFPDLFLITWRNICDSVFLSPSTSIVSLSRFKTSD